MLLPELSTNMYVDANGRLVRITNFGRERITEPLNMVFENPLMPLIYELYFKTEYVTPGKKW